MVVLVVGAIVVLERYSIPSQAMEPTLKIGERIVVNNLADDPEIGDVVVFHPPVSAGASYGGVECTADRQQGQPCPGSGGQQSEERFIQRVVAGPGDRLRIIGGIPIVDGESLTGDWEVRPCEGLGGCNFREEITIPPDHYFMMGDNRGASQDSRFWGPVPGDWIVGEAVFRYWPPDRFGPL